MTPIEDYPATKDLTNRCECVCHTPGKIILHDHSCCYFCSKCRKNRIKDLDKHACSKETGHE